MSHNIITIDGPAASGKGTLARRLAKHLDYFYLDTGKIYRLIGLKAYKAGLVPEETPELIADIAKKASEKFEIDSLNDSELTSDIAGQMASRTSQFPIVRNAVLDLQRYLANNPPQGMIGTVLDGRDCGTVIIPDAQHKFYVTASTDVRSKRRFEELKARGDDTTFETVLSDMKERDDRDMNRSTAPLKPADDAVIIDTSEMNANDAFENVLKEIEN